MTKDALSIVPLTAVTMNPRLESSYVTGAISISNVSALDHW